VSLFILILEWFGKSADHGLRPGRAGRQGLHRRRWARAHSLPGATQARLAEGRQPRAQLRSPANGPTPRWKPGTSCASSAAAP